MGMGGNGKPPQWEWELPALPWEFIPTDFLLRLAYCVISIVTCSCHSPDASALCAEFADYHINVPEFEV